MKITPDILLATGFTKVSVSPEESGCENEYHYYIYEVQDKCILISDCNDENDGGFSIEFFNMENLIKIKDSESLLKLMEVIKRNTL
jgi:hypothetical protein